MSTIYGFFVNNMWRDEKNGKSFFKLKTKYPLFMECMYISKEIKRNKATNEDEIWFTIIVDASNISIPTYTKGHPLKVEGSFTSKQEGLSWEFKANEVDESSNDEETTINYLNSERFPDITLEMAANIVARMGSDIHSYIRTNRTVVAELEEITGLEREICVDIVSTIDESLLEKEVYSVLAKANIPYPYCIKAVKIYGRKALEQIKKTPYKVGSKVGLSFLMCDKLAKSLGCNPFDSGRLKAACMDVMDMFATQGNIYTPLDTFKKAINKKLQNEVFTEKVTALNVVSMMNDSFAIERIDGVNCIYSKRLVEAEKRVARNIKRLSEGSVEPYENSLIEYASKACNMTYGKQQQAAFPTVLSKRGVKIITGGPGTGKTTTIKGILLAYQRMHPDHIIKLCAPTGRASQRMSESTGMTASTIHRLLDYRPYGDNISYKDANDPIQADLIVVDEMSMTDIVLFDIFLEAVKTGTTVILVGDIHQLESVGPGAVLHDLLKSEDTVIQKALLTEVFRQKGGSPIIDNAEKINNGTTTLTECEDFQIIRTKSEEESLEKIVELSKTFYKPDSPFETQILCPSRSGLAGIDNLNVVLHDQLNPEGKTLVYGKQKFRVNDKILMTKNNILIDYYNGDIGIVKEIKDDGMVVEIRDNDITLTRDMLDDIKLSYGMTIHKSQGSEFLNVIVVMPMEPKNMLVRNLFYTGVTRAKKRVFIVNEGSAMETAIKVDKSGSRRTLLSRLLPV